MSATSLVSTLADLVRIPSVNPAYEGGVSETAVCTWIERFFTGLGIETWTQEVFPGRPNLIARIPGKDPHRRVILEAHTDTASAVGMDIPPFEPTFAGGKLFGRGACDTKAGLAAMMHAVASLRADHFVPPCEVWLAATADEEFSYRGVVRLCQGLTAHAAVVAEPTELQLVIATKGVVRWKIRTHGRSAHSSKPDLGVNAINHMSRLVLALEQDNLRLADAPHPLLGPATCNVGVIQGGIQVNFVPAECVIEIDRRLLPGESVSEVLDRYQKLIDFLSASHPGFAAGQDPPMLTDEPLDTSPIESPVQLASEILRELGFDGTPRGVPFGSDASKLSRHGVPSMVFGPGSIDQAHAAREYVEMSQVEAAFEFYRQFIRRFE